MEREVVELFESAKKAAEAASGASPCKADVSRCVDALQQLKGVPVTSSILVSTQVGKRLRSLTKHPEKDIEVMASELLDIWKKVVMEEAARKKNGTTDNKSSVKVGMSKSESFKVERREVVKVEKIEPSVKTEAVKIEPNVNIEAVKIEPSVKTEAVKIEPSVKTEAVKIEKSVKTEAVKVEKTGIAPPKLTSMVKCNNDLRDKIRHLLAEALSKVAHEADEDIKDEVNACDPIRVAISVESMMFEKLGLSTGGQKMKYRSIMFNIKDPKNPDFRRKVLLGIVKPEMVVTMSAEEMASDQRQMENKQIKEKALFECERGLAAQASTDQFRCGRCGQRKCTYYQMQTRSADEPMTTYVTCVNCDNHWKFC